MLKLICGAVGLFVGWMALAHIGAPMWLVWVIGGVIGFLAMCAGEKPVTIGGKPTTRVLTDEEAAVFMRCHGLKVGVDGKWQDAYGNPVHSIRTEINERR